jgi:dihydrofolate reductase
MKTVLIFVTTLDGKITQGNDPFIKKWTSPQDQSYFEQVWNNAPLIVLGSGTFDADPIPASRNHLLVIMTSHPEKYQPYTVDGQLEFLDASPTHVVEKYKSLGYPQMLIAGGAQIATSFLKEKLVNELWLTIEPRIFGKGKNFVVEEKLDIELKLLSSEKINEVGTFINKYKITT